MADLEAVLADVSYLMALEKSKSSSTTNKTSKRMVLPDHSVRSVMTRHLLDRDELKFEKLIKQKLAFLLFKDYCIKNQDIRFELYDKIDKLKLIHDKNDKIESEKVLIDSYFFNSTLMFLISKPIVYSETIMNTISQGNTQQQQQQH
jgi:beta-adrenergic-receptor kinase